MSEQESLASCQAFVADKPVEPTAEGLLGFQGRLIDWIITQPIEKLRSLGPDKVATICEEAFDNALGDYNFPQIPDWFEVPSKAYARSLIRPLVIQTFEHLVAEAD